MGVQSFDLLVSLCGDEEMATIMSEQRIVESWLQVEAALATAQADCGVIDRADADAAAAACRLDAIDLDDLWDKTRNVGYPILPLVRQVAAALPAPASGRVHYGATTQDIMDTGMVLVLAEACDRLSALAARLGDGLAHHVDTHRHTPIAARTHGQQAVPSTFGAKLAVFLTQVSDAVDTIASARATITRVNLWGAGGTAAALGDTAAATRARVAELLGLADSPTPWHVDRTPLLDYGHACTRLATVCVRLAREIVDLSRTEIDEVSEGDGHHYGASSTMPQKSNPIASEMIIGSGVVAATLAGALARAAEAGHERAAGEWQIEWTVLPQLSVLTAAAVATSAAMIEGLTVKADRMAANLEHDHGLVMAEAYMIALAGPLGREAAHDLVYAAVRKVRREGGDLSDHIETARLGPESYLGLADEICAAALARWNDHRTATTVTRRQEHHR